MKKLLADVEEKHRRPVGTIDFEDASKEEKDMYFAMGLDMCSGTKVSGILCKVAVLRRPNGRLVRGH